MDVEGEDMTVRYATRTVSKVEVLFYGEAGPADPPVLLLLHGVPTTGHMFRDLIPLLADRYRVIAPDLPGFGNTTAAPQGKFDCAGWVRPRPNLPLFALADQDGLRSASPSMTVNR